jgi:phosphohistidine phosphatase
MPDSKEAFGTGPFVGGEGKTLLIGRHAKSSWDIGTLNDFDRPLNDRGKKDASAMAKRLIDRNILIDTFVSSPAKRAKNTAELFCEAYGKKAADIELVSMLYHPEVNNFYEAIEQLDRSANIVAIFSHNPGITEFVNTLTETVRIDNIPTCGVFAIQILSDEWTNFKKAKKQFLFFDYPKNA